MQATSVSRLDVDSSVAKTVNTMVYTKVVSVHVTDIPIITLSPSLGHSLRNKSQSLCLYFLLKIQMWAHVATKA